MLHLKSDFSLIMELLPCKYISVFLYCTGWLDGSDVELLQRPHQVCPDTAQQAGQSECEGRGMSVCRGGRVLGSEI